MDPVDDTELIARFERDALPLLEGFYRQALKLTHNHAEAEDLSGQKAAAATLDILFRRSMSSGWLTNS